jgi:hypothetical protein
MQGAIIHGQLSIKLSHSLKITNPHHRLKLLLTKLLLLNIIKVQDHKKVHCRITQWIKY